MKTIASANLKKRYRRFSDQQIDHFLRDFAASEVSAAAFAREHDLSYPVFLRWLQEHDSQAGLASQPLALREVPLAAALGATGWAAEVVQPNGVTVRLAGDISPQLVALLLNRC